MIIGIDLLWVKPQVNGGGESYIRNLLDGFYKAKNNNIEFILFVASNNYSTFSKYAESSFIKIVKCNISSNNSMKRIIWENIFLNKVAIKNKVNIMFVPVYSKPLYKNRRIKYVITIHDLQAIHFPEYFSFIKNLWLKIAWKTSANTADKIVAISNFDKNDIISNLKVDQSNIEVIYNPVIKSENTIGFKEVEEKYNISSKNYFYTVSSMLPHKNLKTLLYVIKKIKEQELALPKKLVISGVGGKSIDEIKFTIKELSIENEVILTGFVSNEIRDSLYKHAKVFLFPSVFEGFGMPPVESLLHGTPIVACGIDVIKEVTQNQGLYVQNYFNEDEWIEKILLANDCETMTLSNEEAYELSVITNKYIELFNNI